ncbi:MAG: hypothetical protein K9L02_07105 [Acholeplasmataceae bacterium]|nr:hypothetical protein [Acholeplasmataceae bacterium]
MKLIKRLLVLIIVLALALVIGVIIIARSVAVEVTDEDLPQDVYMETGDLLTIAELNLANLVFADEQDQFTIIEEFMNYILLDSIRTNINSAYDPLGDLNTDNANYVISDGAFYIDYVYAELNDTDQMVICISFGTDQYYQMHSALYLTFDIDIEIVLLNINVVLTLSEYRIADKELSMRILDFVFDKLDKSTIEDSMTFGTLDLDEYTFTISLIG